MKTIRNTSLNQKGFALIATVAILALVVMVSLAMVSLATSVSKSSSNADAFQEARANARLALAQAIAHLQRTAGKDTRITLPASSLIDPPATPGPLTAVFKSWEGENHDPLTGLPIVPDYSSKLVFNPDPSDPTNRGKFIGWLVSGVPGNDPLNPPDVTCLLYTSPSPRD